MPKEARARLVETFDLEVFTPPCEPGAERFAARGRLPADISGALPYLNATLRGAVYTPLAQALIWKKGGHTIAFHAYEILTSNAADRQEAEMELRSMIELVNRTWERRAEIAPDHHTRQRPTAMALYRLMPGSNCKQCGSPTCFTFVLRLVSAQVAIEACPVILEPERTKDLEALRALLIDAPSIG